MERIFAAQLCYGQARWVAKQIRFQERNAGRRGPCEKYRRCSVVQTDDHARGGVVAHHAAVVHTAAGDRSFGKGIRYVIVVRAKRFCHIRLASYGRQRTAALLLSLLGAGKMGKQRVGMRLCKVANAAAVSVPICADAKAVADGSARIGLHHPVFAAGFEHEELALVEHEKRVVIIKRVVIAAVATLTITLQEFDNHADCALRALPALQRETQEIHAGQRGRAIVSLGKHRLVADGDARLVNADLRAPHPGWPGEQYAERFAYFGNQTIGAGNLLLVVDAGGIIFAYLRLVRAAVAVFSEECRGA
ncbi:hypothetical protein SDC9_149127 [bioreactor metagenome]|uniref:Uncharacterized protein n=1 Tax=bioreactor metagenome TaxID=1076179 RepID=A0A645EMM5_9ZZZZ